MSDIGGILAAWPFDAHKVQARLVKDSVGREAVQMRVDLGVLQFALDGRPDGEVSALDRYRELEAKAKARSDRPLFIPPEDYAEVDREIMQHFHRRLAMFELGDFARAARDAEHCIELAGFAAAHVEDAGYARRLVGMLPRLMMERARADALGAIGRRDAEAAAGHIRDGITRIQEHLRASGVECGGEEAGEIAFLRRWERKIIRANRLGDPLEALLESAVEREDYAEAARLRDALRRRRAPDA